MATSYKKKRMNDEDNDDYLNDENEVEVHDDSENDDFDDEDSSDGEINEEIQIEFEAFPPQDNDFHGIKRLLQQLFAKTKVNMGEFTDLILSQNHVGCVVKQSEGQLAEESDSDDDDDDIFGFTTVLNITEKKDVKCIKEMRSFIEERCSACNSEAQVNELSRLLDDESHSIGLLLSERFVNIPPQLAPPLHSSLQNDIRRAAAKNPHFKFDYYLLLSKAYQHPQGPTAGKKSKSDASDSSWLFANAEDEFFFKESVLSLHYWSQVDQAGIVAGKWTEDDEELKSGRVVIVVPASKMNTLLSQIQEAFSIG